MRQQGSTLSLTEMRFLRITTYRRRIVLYESLR
jgi:hypothetical protein